MVAPQSASALAADTAEPIQLPERGPGTAGGSGYLPVSEHGLIGDMRSVALVGTNGSIDWYYCPSFDSPAVFGSSWTPSCVPGELTPLGAGSVKRARR